MNYCSRTVFCIVGAGLLSLAGCRDSPKQAQTEVQKPAEQATASLPSHQRDYDIVSDDGTYIIGRDFESILADLKHDDPAIRLRAVKAFPTKAEEEYRPGVPDLVLALESDHAKLQHAAVVAILNVARYASDRDERYPELETAIAPLLEILKTAEEETRRYSTFTIAEVALNLGPEAIKAVLPAMIEAGGDESYSVGGTAIEGLGSFGPASESAIPFLIEQVHSVDLTKNRPEIFRPIRAAVSLGKICSRPDLCVPALSQLLKQIRTSPKLDSGGFAAGQVATALRQFGPDAALAIAELEMLLDATDEDVQQAAAFALGQIGPAAVEAIPELVSTFQRCGRDKLDARLATFAALVSIGPEGRASALALAGQIKQFKIDRVGLSNYAVLDNPVDVLDVLAEAGQLTGIGLQNSTLSDDEIAPLARLQNLEYLVLPEGVADNGIQHIAKLTRLRSVVQYRTSVENWSKAEISDDGLKQLANLRELRTLRLCATITSNGLDHLKGLEKLESLGLTTINDEALQFMPQFPALQTLTLGGNDVTDKGMESLARLFALNSLGLRATEVGDAGIAVLARDHPDLEFLNLSHCPITSACVADLSKMTNLKDLIVCFTPLAGNRDIFDMRRTDAVMALQKALPFCDVMYAD